MAGCYLLVTALAASASADQASAREWLNRMSAAFEQQDYDGTFSYFDGRDLTSLRVVHKVVDGRQRERLVHLNGAPREILRDGEDVACIFLPGDRLVELAQSIPSGPFARAFVRDYDRMAVGYDVVMGNEGRIAGRRAVQLLIAPTDEHRYGYRLWLDLETALLLRSELVNQKGAALEILQFATLSLGADVADSALEPEQNPGMVVSHLKLANADALRHEETGKSWRASWLPVGFSMASADVRRAPGSLAAVNTLVYSDGLAAFSIFVEAMPDRGATAAQSIAGATVAVSELIATNHGRQLVTVVGEIPANTARKIARSVKLNGGR
ncbi:MAG: MucB/RseB C-terminal domain-containing protein [Pseudomonadaceae bacterium]|nr:MucB/RseB C-terminal domain-containing protein [Pseudomonadaceae bacterium]